MILHIPHSSIDTLGKEFLCDLSVELERMTDVDTDILFNYSNAVQVIFPISRLICDVERFEDDNLEEMEKKGMGVCYTTNSYGKPLRIIEDKEKQNIISKYYRVHHQKLTSVVKKELKENGKSLIIDCHSFSNIPLPHENSQITPRPDICIGTDTFHTSKDILNQVVTYFERCGYVVSVNSPFSGTLIPMVFYKVDKRVYGLMIEVNRDLYKNDFETVKNNIVNCLSNLTY